MTAGPSAIADGGEVELPSCSHGGVLPSFLVPGDMFGGLDDTVWGEGN